MVVYGQDFSENKKERNFATWSWLRETNSRALGSMGQRDHSMRGCPGDWIIVQREEGDWGLWSWVNNRVPGISSHVVPWIWLSYFPRPCYFCVWILTPAFITNSLILFYTLNGNSRNRDNWIGPVTPVGWFAFGRELSLWSSQSWLGSRLS